MAKRIYSSGNYIILDDDLNEEVEISKVGSFYTETSGNFNIHNKETDQKTTIATSAAGTWYDETGLVAYSESTLRTFLRENTGFSTALGGSSANFANEDLIFTEYRGHQLGAHDLDMSGDESYLWLYNSSPEFGIGVGASEISSNGDKITISTPELHRYTGTVDKYLGSGFKKTLLSGLLSTDGWSVSNSTNTSMFFNIIGTGLVSAFKGMEVRSDSDSAFKVYSGASNAPIQNIYNNAGTAIYEFREGGGAAVAYFKNSLGAVNISFNASSGILDAVGGFSVDGVTGIGANTGTTYTIGGGSSGDLASIRIAKGIITGITLVP